MYILKRSAFWILMISFLVVGCEGTAETPARRIAHAGGGIDGETYTDSFEAMNSSIKAGFYLLEIDFSWTLDRKLACIHYWQSDFARFFGFPISSRPTLDNFKRLVKERSPYHLCTLDELADWMVKNPEMILVTDVKVDNLRALGLIARRIEGFEERVIAQIYLPENYQAVKDLGYKNIIWTLYRYPGSRGDVLSWVKKLPPLYAVTMPAGLAATGFGLKIQELGIYTYTHTINSKDELERYRSLGIDNVYTDFLPPE